MVNTLEYWTDTHVMTVTFISQPEKFVEHMHDEHVVVPEDESFDINILEKWASTNRHSVVWSNLPESVVARREQAIRNKEAKEANKEVTSQPQATNLSSTPTTPSLTPNIPSSAATTTTPSHTPSPAPLPTPQVRDTAHPGLAQWSGSILGSYLESMATSITRLTQMTESLHAKNDWQSRAILELQNQLYQKEIVSEDKVKENQRNSEPVQSNKVVQLEENDNVIPSKKKPNTLYLKQKKPLL